MKQYFLSEARMGSCFVALAIAMAESVVTQAQQHFSQKSIPRNGWNGDRVGCLGGRGQDILWHLQVSDAKIGAIRATEPRKPHIITISSIRHDNHR